MKLPAPKPTLLRPRPKPPTPNLQCINKKGLDIVPALRLFHVEQWCNQLLK
jgi:hypothetical protein